MSLPPLFPGTYYISAKATADGKENSKIVFDVVPGTMNNLSIFIDIDQEFDKVLKTIAIGWYGW